MALTIYLSVERYRADPDLRDRSAVPVRRLLVVLRNVRRWHPAAARPGSGRVSPAGSRRIGAGIADLVGRLGVGGAGLQLRPLGLREWAARPADRRADRAGVPDGLPGRKGAGGGQRLRV